ncbi:MAG: hypothetical protein COB67_11070 [SAR324 cluster bacterium]|uniref:Tetratricopeptide repeat protein n=1 Tax=SAR324 cluster bacterium TaxID=2024889 RepID=A0A2A4SUF1_9DELT|nr:MAG: hypothetical protein COB67_11070 [SAR324 cluster bacterium]
MRFFQDREDIPETAVSRLFLAGYYSWFRQWEKAIDVLKQLPTGENTAQVILEKIRLNLYLGRYTQALKLLESAHPLRVQDRFQKEILWGWYDLLVGHPEKITSRIQELEKTFLYLSTSVLITSDFLSLEPTAVPLLEKWIVQNPEDLEIYEELYKHYWKTQQWGALSRLITGQKTLTKMTSQLQVIEDLLKKEFKQVPREILSGRRNLSLTPATLESLAEIARTVENWELLKMIALTFTQNYPELMDGSLYLAEYYQNTKGFVKRK